MLPREIITVILINQRNLQDSWIMALSEMVLHMSYVSQYLHAY